MILGNIFAVFTAFLLLVWSAYAQDMCPMEYDPYCGCKTYGNKCLMEQAQKKDPALTATKGECWEQTESWFIIILYYIVTNKMPDIFVLLNNKNYNMCFPV